MRDDTSRKCRQDCNERLQIPMPDREMQACAAETSMVGLLLVQTELDASRRGELLRLGMDWNRQKVRPSSIRFASSVH